MSFPSYQGHAFRVHRSMSYMACLCTTVYSFRLCLLHALFCAGAFVVTQTDGNYHLRYLIWYEKSKHPFKKNACGGLKKFVFGFTRFLYFLIPNFSVSCTFCFLCFVLLVFSLSCVFAFLYFLFHVFSLSFIFTFLHFHFPVFHFPVFHFPVISLSRVFSFLDFFLYTLHGVFVYMRGGRTGDGRADTRWWRENLRLQHRCPRRTNSTTKGSRPFARCRQFYSIFFPA